MGNECVGKAKNFAQTVQDTATEKLWEAFESYSNYGAHNGYKQASRSERDFENGSLLKNDSDEEALDFDEDKNETQLLDNEKLSKIKIGKSEKPQKKKKEKKSELKEQLLDLEQNETQLSKEVVKEEESKNSDLLDMQVEKPQHQEQPVNQLMEELDSAARETEEEVHHQEDWNQEWNQQYSQEQYDYGQTYQESQVHDRREQVAEGKLSGQQNYLMQELADAIDDEEEEEGLL